MINPIAPVALLIDAAIGWPQWLYRLIGHPVGGFARVIGWCETNWNRLEHSAIRKRFFGVVTLLILVSLALIAGLALETLSYALLKQWGWIAVGIFAWPALAQRSLYVHVRPVAEALAKGDVEAARSAVSRIVGRDTAELDEAGIARAAIESLAESFCDGIAAPLFWLLVAGLPGIWAYKAINTADSLVGHVEEPWRDFGWASARTDDFANYLPARISGLTLCFAAPGGWAVLWRDHARHASPNAGWPEAAMAGALRVALAGPVSYDGEMNDKAWIGREGGKAGAQDIRNALSIYLRACALLWIFAGLVVWAL
ncbi:MAG: adenosylcobinamide-phosphate synthase CbiB [Pseudomonadota bacterium]